MLPESAIVPVRRHGAGQLACSGRRFLDALVAGEQALSQPVRAVAGPGHAALGLFRLCWSNPATACDTTINGLSYAEGSGVTPRSAPSRRPFCESGGDASREAVRARRPTGQPGADDSTRPHSAKRPAAGRPGSVAARRRPVAVLPRAAAVGHCELDSRLEAWRPHSFGPCRSRPSGYRETACSLTEATRRPA